MTVEAQLRGARVRYGPLEALHGVDLAFPAGRVTVLLGRNGSGRTTVLHALAGLLDLSAGRVLWRGRDITGLDVRRRVRLGLSLVPAERGLFTSLTVAENLGLGPAGADPQDAERLFPELAGLLARPAGVLSGGQQQLVALCRGLLARPRLLLLDEPGRGLAPAVTARLHAILLDSAAEGRTVVLTAQSLPHSLAGAGVVHVLHRGRVAFSGEPAELAEPTEPGPGPTPARA
ncbi:ATP-binding cassette domain-containing protein [Kitasatospora sp. NPDC050543]|uniref:ATP-binding cassette domain-containing protein n=1 Tax=Kitasatospora sp. NPDC050543 TaxID=3364054 RepID=UPI0037B0870E